MTLLGSLLVGILAVAAARAAGGLLADPRPRFRRLVWALLLAPYLTPVLLTGYAYSSFSLSLVHHPIVNTIFYAALLWWKFTPLAAILLHFSPPPLTREAVHCHRLVAQTASLPWRRLPACVWSDRQPTASRRNGRLPVGATLPLRSTVRHWFFLLRAGCARGPIAAFAVVFLFAFGEFEMASLLGVQSWTVTLFDAHAGGLALSESLRRMLGPMACEAAAVATAVAALRKCWAVPARRRDGRGAIPRLGWCHLVVAFVMVSMIPAVMVLWGAFQGMRLVLENFVLTREILASVLFAAAATFVAGLTVWWLGPATRAAGPAAAIRKALLLVAIFAGLLGPLVLSLTVLAAMQWPGLLFLRDTPVPLVVTLGLVLVPVALVLRRTLEMTGHQSARHLTKLMRKSGPARELAWRLSTSRTFWAAVLLFVWAYWDLTASAILAPVGMTPVTVRLYNLMHYGRIAALSAMTGAAFAAPVLIFMLARGTRRWWAP